MPEWLRVLKYGSVPWNAWRHEHPDEVIVLDHADLNGMILIGIDFARVSLRRVSLHATNLMNADLLGASLRGARYSADDLMGALHVPEST